MGGRGKTTRELAEFSDYFLDFETVKARYSADDLTPEHRAALKKCFAEMSETFSDRDWNAPELEQFARGWCEKNAIPLKDIAMPFRFVLSGRKVSPGVFEIAGVLGCGECKRRLAHYGLL
jgi:glutamyl-tRNA synthetase